jgi:peptide/nickel transport system substrate-binding protein
MTKKLAAAVAALTSLGAVTACSGFDGGSSPAASKSDLTVALSMEPSSVEPCDSQVADVGIVLHGNVTQSLTEIDPVSGKVRPELATEWRQVSPTTWSFTLRDGVKFQDGTPMNADSVVSSISRLMNPKLLCKSFEQFPSPVTVTATDARTVTVTTKDVDPILPLRMTFADIVAPSTPAAVKTDKPVGTGPYAFDQRVQGQSVKLTRFDGYWGPKPQATSATFVYRTEASVRANMIKTGEASVAMQIAPQDATTDGRTLEFSDDRVLWFRLPTDRAPFNDIRVRQSVQYALDKSTITSTLMQHSGRPYDQLLSPSVNSYLKDYKGPSYELAKAKALLADARAQGVKVDTEFDLVTRHNIVDNGDEVMQAVAQNLKDAGFKVSIKTLDNDAWLKLLRAPFPPDQKPTMIAISHDNLTGDASFSYPKYIASTGVNSTINDKTIDDLLKKAAVAQGDERAAFYQQASKQEYDNVAAMIPFCEVLSRMMIGPAITYKANPLSNNSLRIADITSTS